MARLPVIVGFGGFNAAGRSSFHQAYQRIVLESLPQQRQQETLCGLAVMMGRVTVERGRYVAVDGSALSEADITARFRQDILDHTLIRAISPEYFDVARVPFRQKVPLHTTEQGTLQFDLPKKKLPATLPEHWQVTPIDDRYVRVNVDEGASVYLESHVSTGVHSAGQLPDGFQPETLYKSRFHPRGLQLSIIGASDAVNASGLDWDQVLSKLSPDQVGAYSSSVMSQLDAAGCGGYLQARLKGERVSTKQVPLGMSSMVSDFINAYVLGNLGGTGSIAGACASFLFNLNAGIQDIRSGRRRLVMVSSSEAPILPEVIEGYATMGALATVEKLTKLDGGGPTDLRRSSRPFGDNCGFVIAESTQHVLLMDDELAIELGATIYGAVPEVFINADGFKKSISAPGPGNYLTFAKAVASARSLLGDESLQQRSFIQAHGSSTPQNRLTESQILDRVAAAFGIHQWPLTAVKAFVGHSLAPASGDQLVNALGVFAQGILPGIKTIDRVAADVLQDRLSIASHDRELAAPMDIAFLNSKGFGGNNATAYVLSPDITYKMLSKRHGERVMTAYQDKNQGVQERANTYNNNYLKGDFNVIYQFGEGMLADETIALDADKIHIPGYGKAIDLSVESPYVDMV